MPPEYLYQHPETKEVVSVIQTMREEHCYEKDGIEYKRVFTKPNASVDSISSLDPFDTRAYVEKTGKMKGNIGSLWNISKEASERRAEKLGHEDPVRRRFFDKYEKKNGTKHFYDRPDKIDAGIATIDFTAPSPEIDL